MHDFSLIFVLISACIYLIGFIPYVYHIFHGRVVPHPFSWTIWCILSAISTYALFSADGATSSLIAPVIRTIALSIGGVIGWFMIRKISINRFDYLFLLLGVSCVLIASYYGVRQAIIPTIILDFLVLSPTIKKIWNDPDSEDIFAWVLVSLSQIFLLLSFNHYTIENSLFWAYQLIINGLVAIFIYRRRLYMSQWTSRVKSFFDSILAFTSKV
ncbi:hypothetical protein H7170_00255 [Candidatus Gracilibacteria bacterium]|nr:hypothetical protein [Candidatus Gracilibacteria bacterium]